jgi:DNA helicase-2/ATP-dependent DNA helicase PcrA
MYILLRDFPDLLYKYQHKFKYILVDEYQDTNHVQYQIVKKLAAVYENICVVGDDAQSIYSFRGANIHNILNFKDDYPEHYLFKLEQNYRSTKNIIHAANSLIKNNEKQIPKLIWTANQTGDKIKVIQAADDSEEAEAIVKSIKENKQKYKLENKDFTILYRTNAQSRPFEEVLRRENIPYRIYGGMSFYSRKEIKDMLAYFRVTINPRDDEALRRIINYPQRGIGTNSIERIIAATTANSVPLWNIIENPHLYDLKLTNLTLRGMDNFVTKIRSYQADLHKKNAFELGKHIAESSGLAQELREDTEEKERYENLGELFNAMQNFVERPPQHRIDLETGEELEEVFPSLDQFLNEVALYTDADKDEKDDNNKVKLMTIHAAKGLEFPFTYEVGLEESLLPFYLIENQDDLEEERRLFYVAVTRAKESLTLSFAQRRRVFGSYSFSQPSPFLREIDPSVLETITSALSDESKKPKPVYSPKSDPSAPIPQKKPIFQQMRRHKSNVAPPVEVDPKMKMGEIIILSSQLSIGMRVFHAKFGVGTIADIANDENKATIDFGNAGKKVMLLNFAKLRTVL